MLGNISPPMFIRWSRAISPSFPVSPSLCQRAGSQYCRLHKINKVNVPTPRFWNPPIRYKKKRNGNYTENQQQIATAFLYYNQTEISGYDHLFSDSALAQWCPAERRLCIQKNLSIINNKVLIRTSFVFKQQIM